MLKCLVLSHEEEEIIPCQDGQRDSAKRSRVEEEKCVSMRKERCGHGTGRPVSRSRETAG